MQSFELYRLSLTMRAQKDIESPISDPARVDYLRQVFSGYLKFMHHGIEYHYVPAPDQSSDTALLGRIGRAISTVENLPPHEGFQERVHESWKASVIVTDPTEHADGQKVAVQVDNGVGKTSRLIYELIEEINVKNMHSAYHIEVEPIFSPDSFWDFVKENEGEITSLTFEFVAPNMFGGHDSITEELRNFRDHERAQKVRISLHSSDGLKADTNNVKESVDYVTKGCGKIRARAGGRSYNSTKKTQTTHIDVSEEEKEPFLVTAAKKISRILGRE